MQTWSDTGYTPARLRVALSSLQQLADIRSSEFPMPNSIPTSHADTAPARRAQSRQRAGHRPAPRSSGARPPPQQQPQQPQQQQLQQPQQQRRPIPPETDSESEGGEGSEDQAGGQAGGSEGDAEIDAVAIAMAQQAAARSIAKDRTGSTLEVQGCDSNCDFICPDCDWEPCTVLQDHGHCCDRVMCSSHRTITGDDAPVMHHASPWCC